MDSIENIRTFLTVCRSGSFVQAARQLGLSASVVTKRVTQLEWQLKTTLLDRTTRSVSLTESGKRQLHSMEQLVQDHALLLTGGRDRDGIIEGPLRVSAPASLATTVLARPFSIFQRTYPAVTLEVTLLDRSVNPIEEGFDVSLVVLPVLFDDVQVETLCRYPRLLCATPDYVNRAGVPLHPRDLAQHDCIGYNPSGKTWTFDSDSGPLHVPIQPTIVATDSRMVIELVRQGAGVGIMSLATVRTILLEGGLLQLLPNFPVPSLHVRAFTPKRRHMARAETFVRFIRADLEQQALQWQTCA